jgi:hypothetical protein
LKMYGEARPGSETLSVAGPKMIPLSGPTG